MRCVLFSMVSAVALTACINHVNVQCAQNSDCNQYDRGVCSRAAGTPHQWCAYPDPNCGPDGLRYSTVEVGDGVSGTCVLSTIQDAGIDIDASVDGATDAAADAAPAQPSTSCIALPHTCGVGANDDCCNSLEVPGGTYSRGFDVGGGADSGAQGSVATVGTFALDKYEVTVGRFRAFVSANQGTQVSPPPAGSGTNAHIPGSGWQSGWNTELAPNSAALSTALRCTLSSGSNPGATWTDIAADNETLPITCVTWYEAMAFCAWDGGFLPTDAELNYASAGGDQQRAYPWSSPPQDLTLDIAHASYGCLGDGMSGLCSLADIGRVGTRPMGNGRWGHADLAGNASEWALDWHKTTFSVCLGGLNTTTDCADLDPNHATNRVVRGGAFIGQTSQLRTGTRANTNPVTRFGNYGMRCARAH